MPKIYSEELEQAGFGMLGNIVPAINYVARLDGATQYWQLSEDINLIFGDIVKLKVDIIEPPGSFSFITDGVSDSDRVYLLINSDNSITFNDSVIGSLKVNEVQYANGSTPPIYGVGFCEFEVELNSGAALAFLGARYSQVSLLPGSVKGLQVVRGGTVLHEIPLTNKAQGATQLPTVGNVNATMINYTEAVWKKENEL